MMASSLRIGEPHQEGDPVRTAHLAVKIIALLTVLLAIVVAATVLSAAEGSARLQAYFARDFTDVPYQQKAYQKVISSWKVPAKTPPPGSKTVVIATIGRDGRIATAVLHMKSGEALWDDSALSAVKAASPLPSFPPGYPNATTEVHFHFEWSAPPRKG
jgi:TonB family protein